MILKPLKWLIKHKIISLVSLAVIGTGSYFIYQNNDQSTSKTEYVTAQVEKGMLVSSISGSGQVSSSNQVDISPDVSGDVIDVAVVQGQEVKKGDLIAQIDSSSAAIQVSEARAAYENAKLDLDELLAPLDDYSKMQAENSVIDARDSLTKLEFNQKQEYQAALQSKEDAYSDFETAYEDAYSDVSDAFLDIPDIMAGLSTILFSRDIADSESTVQQGTNTSVLVNSFSSSDWYDQDRFRDYVDDAEDDYDIADGSYDTNFDNYRDVSRYSEQEVIEALVAETLETTKQISDALKSTTNMIDFWVEYRMGRDYMVYSLVTEYQSDLTSYTSKANSHLSALLSAQRSMENAQQDIIDAETNIEELDQNQPLDLAAAQRSLREKEESLANLLAGATELEIKNKQLSVQQKYNSLVDAQQNWLDYQIKAPFDGVVASLDVAVGDSVGSSSAVASIITKQRIAEITLNEIDAAQVEVGQRVTLEFDAVSDLSVTGEVLEVDAIGTVNQGVVSYDVKIGFDVQEDKIKPGMSTSVNIITVSKQNVLLVPISAVKTVGGSSYVEMMIDGQVQRQNVVTGDSNDTMIEITEGLSEGDEIVTQTVTSSASSSQSSTSQTPQADMGGMMRAFR